MGQDPQQGTDTPTHDTGTRRGEDLIDSEGKEPGRYDKGETGAERPAGGSTARDSTGINPDDEDPIDPDSPNLGPA